MKKIIVLAGNRREFQDYLIRSGGLGADCIYATHESLYGIDGKEIIRIGTFHERADAHYLALLAQSRLQR